MRTTSSTITHGRNRIRDYDLSFASDKYAISSHRSTSIGTEISSRCAYDYDVASPRAARSRESHSPSNWLSMAAEQLSAIAELSAGWDAHGAAPPIGSIVEGAWTLLDSLARTGIVPKPHIYPSRSGGVQLEWEVGSKYLEIELFSDHEATFFYSDPSSSFETTGQLRQEESLGDVLQFIDGMYR